MQPSTHRNSTHGNTRGANFEIGTVGLDEPTDIDIDAYVAARQQGMMPPAVPIATNQHEGPDEPDDEPTPVVELLPNLLPISRGMQSSMGFGLDAIAGVLNVVTQWDTDAEVSATKTTVDSVVDECVEFAVGADRNEFRAAAQWLTLQPSDLDGKMISHWETERRSKRILTSPLIAAGPDEIWLLPWATESTLRVFANYLQDGRLPWPNSSLPKPVTQALNRYRQARNREVETECVAQLRAAGFVVRGGVKPEKRRHYGIALLSGEVDAICIDSERSRIWVIEAKDPYTPYSARQIRRSFNDFHEPDGYVDKLIKKVGEISASSTSLAAALGVSTPDRQWTARGLIVTRHVEPAAFATEPLVPFCALESLVDTISRNEIEVGHHGWPLD